MLRTHTPEVAIISDNPEIDAEIKAALGPVFDLFFFTNGIILYNGLKKGNLKPSIILSVSNYRGIHGLPLKLTIDKLGFSNLPFFLVTDTINQVVIKECLKNGIKDVFGIPIKAEAMVYRLQFFLKYSGSAIFQKKAPQIKEFKMPVTKRIVDVIVSGTALLLLSPLLIIVAFLIKNGSKGPAIYYSYRVGTGYNIFKFYKFRSMETGADSKLKELKHLNQYKSDSRKIPVNPVAVTDLCEMCEQTGRVCLHPIYDDKGIYCEKISGTSTKGDKESAFIKIQDDPRVTRIGKFIRNTSIDELPQLWNVFIGDMSLVGNRPLPLYEAEKITTDKYALRFFGPAGITGLWQVEKRGRGAMSEDERLSLDNDYVKNFNFLFDVKIILRTLPALFQSENV